MKFRIALGLIAALALMCRPAGVRADYIEYDLGSLGKAITELAGAKLLGVETGTDSSGTSLSR